MTAPSWRTQLTGPERLWLESQAAELSRPIDDRPPRSLTHRLTKAVDKWSLEAGYFADGLETTTVTEPPSTQGGEIRRGSGPSDPTGRALHATLDALTREAEAWAHLTGPCPRDGERDETGRLHECPDGSAVDVADMLGLVLDPDDVVDGLLGTPPSSTQAFAAIVSRASAWHSEAASLTKGAWQQAWQHGAETSALEAAVTACEQLARRMAALAGRLAEWSGREERKCSCGGAAPPVGEGATCQRCRKRASRQSA